MSDLTGKSIGRYHILEQLGEGGMAVVYKAYDTRLETEVAVKVIRTENILPKVRERALKRFEREAKALARLTHPNIIPILDYGEYDGEPYLIMKYIPGGTLKDHLQKGALPWEKSVRLLIPIARALDYAHRQEMIHRDVKPSNILITSDGEPMLTDFGVAKIIDEEATMDLTGTSAAVGTPEYMAPEQVTSKNVDHRADIYAFGIVFYEMVTGRKPFQADTPMAVLFKHASEPLPRPGAYQKDLPGIVEKILLKALAKAPEDRYQTMGEMVVALEKLLIAPGGAKQQIGRKTKNTVNLSFQQPQKSRESKPVGKSAWLTYGIGAGVLVACIAIFWVGSRIMEVLSTVSSPITDSTTTEELVSETEAPTPIELGVGSTMTGEDGMTLLYVPAGEFQMGSERYDDEKPRHTVYLDAYWIDQTEVTNEMFVAFLNSEGNQSEGEITWLDAGDGDERIHQVDGTWQVDFGYQDHPVIEVSWYGAMAYCAWVGRHLPTEAEWEKAAGWDADAGAQRTYPWGESIDQSYANYDQIVGDTTPVGSYEKGKSFYGAYDMAGNVWELVADWYGVDYYKNSQYNYPVGPSSGQGRVVRGGSWDLNYIFVRSANRVEVYPTNASADIGFRCAMLAAE